MKLEEVLGYIPKEELGKITYKDYKPIPLADQQQAIDEENKENDSTKPVAAKAPTIAPMYFYHPDHLGTNTALTDFNGSAYQFFINLPFGETMAQQLGSSYYTSPYKFNGKELDEETGFYYYGARYYDPRISVWMSVDPLAEKFNNRNPYEYCFSNPINLTDPTGMGPEDGEGDPPLNILIVIDFDGKNSLDRNRETVTFTDLEKNGWKGIYAKDIEDANDQLTKYLKGRNADNVLLQTHGGLSDVKDSKGNIGSYLSVDNNNKVSINTAELEQRINGQQANNKNITSLLSIIGQIKDGGTFNLNACNIGSRDSFFYNLMDLSNNRINILGYDGLCSVPGTATSRNDTNINYVPHITLNRNTIQNGSGKLYKPECNNYPPEILNNIQLTKYGFKY